jgi:hypothetical protein
MEAKVYFVGESDDFNGVAEMGIAMGYKGFRNVTQVLIQEDNAWYLSNEGNYFQPALIFHNGLAKEDCKKLAIQVWDAELDHPNYIPVQSYHGEVLNPISSEMKFKFNDESNEVFRMLAEGGIWYHINYGRADYDFDDKGRPYIAFHNGEREE